MSSPFTGRAYPLLWALALILTTAAACRAPHSSPDGRDAPHTTRILDHHAPSGQEMLNGRVDLAEPWGIVRLVNGVATLLQGGRSRFARNDT
jgi:hypothetical protein